VAVVEIVPVQVADFPNAGSAVTIHVSASYLHRNSVFMVHFVLHACLNVERSGLIGDGNVAKSNPLADITLSCPACAEFSEHSLPRDFVDEANL
jgi:hypothetical protein